MPDAKDNAKATGDIHLPEIEADDLDQQSRPRAGEIKGELKDESAGEIKDRDAETSNSYDHTRDSGERPKP